MDYFERAGLVTYLEKLGFDLVGFGCTTCIGNSGPLLPEISEAINAEGLACAAVLSGNRNFEGRIHPDVRMNYLASPPLVVAYALAGTMDIDLATEPLGTRRRRPARVPEATLALLAGSGRGLRAGRRRRDVPPRVRRGLPRRRHWRALEVPAGQRYDWDETSTYVRKPPYFEAWRPSRSRSPTSSAPECSPSSATASRPTTSRPPARSRPSARPASGCRNTACPSPSSTPTAHGAATTRS